MRRALQLIFALGLFGMLFSGVLSYRELFGDAPTCTGLGAPGTFFAWPACVYGLIVYSLVVAAAAGGLVAARRDRKGAAAGGDRR